jgi:hypothetical protein
VIEVADDGEEVGLLRERIAQRGAALELVREVREHREGDVVDRGGIVAKV